MLMSYLVGGNIWVSFYDIIYLRFRLNLTKLVEYLVASYHALVSHFVSSVHNGSIPNDWYYYIIKFFIFLSIHTNKAVSL